MSTSTEIFLEGFEAMQKRLEVLGSPKIRDRIAKAGLGSLVLIIEVEASI